MHVALTSMTTCPVIDLLCAMSDTPRSLTGTTCDNGVWPSALNLVGNATLVASERVHV
jgi:hypothetical protein